MTPGVRALLCAVLLAAAGCAPRTPPAAQLEALAMTASQQQSAEAEGELRLWAERGAAVAQRELGLLYASRPARAKDSAVWLSRAARQGDAEAACAMGDSLRAPSPAAAWPWYAQAAAAGHARAALMLGLMARNGDGIARDPRLALRWLERAAGQGNAHAMFLLSNMLRDGEAGVADAAHARVWLERAAENDYPGALHELALTVQLGDGQSPKDKLRAQHLLKEATEHRHNNWNHF